MTARELLIAMAVHYNGNWDDLVRALRKRDYLSEEEVKEKLKEVHSNVLTMIDPDYPLYLKQFYQPPIVLFYYGDISLLKDPKKCLGVVGSRSSTPEGEKITKDIVTGLAKDYVIVSGMAKGIDRQAHLAAIENGGKTIAVLGTGIDICYPSANRDIYDTMKNGHLIVSEHIKSDYSHETFPFRNRLIAQFSKGLLVTEATIKSGTSITIYYALAYGKYVMCVPSINYGNSGCNAAIREGATLVENAEQVREMLE